MECDAALMFDPTSLITALPRMNLTVPPGIEQTRKPAWQHTPLAPYNGFAGEERIRHWQLAVILRRLGALPDPSRCDLCGATERVGWHAEHYGDVQKCVPLCWQDHMTLHRRFAAPAAWRARVERCEPKSEWFWVLPAEPFDLASWLAVQFGAHARDPWHTLAPNHDLTLNK